MKTFLMVLFVSAGMLFCSKQNSDPKKSTSQKSAPAENTTPSAGGVRNGEATQSGDKTSFLCHCLNPDNTETSFIMDGKDLPGVKAEATKRCQKISSSFKQCSPSK